MLNQTKSFMLVPLFLLTFLGYKEVCTADTALFPIGKKSYNCIKNIRDFDVLPTNSAAVNKQNLQKAIDWASPLGAALYVEPADTPYPIDGGILLKSNVSLVGVHGPVGRGARHPQKIQPVGSVFAIEDRNAVFITVENATQIRGIQFWYPKQTISNPKDIIEYPATIQISKTKGAQGVTLSCLTFYGEFLAMDFNAGPKAIAELILFEHCYGYPLSGEFIRIDYCYDIPRILHCHINPANRRFIEGQYTREVTDSVIARKTFAYRIDHTDNAQCIDLFTFATFGGIYLGASTYGQLTNFNFDCVSVGILKQGDNSFNRNWQISQGSIIANIAEHQSDVHPLIIEGQGHTSLLNVEAFSGHNSALTTLGQSQDYLLVRGDQKLTITMTGCRMKNYIADSPITCQNPNAVIWAAGCIDKNDNIFEFCSKK
jgi:hypothetical protein